MKKKKKKREVTICFLVHGDFLRETRRGRL
jgi:hypothetical protein